MILQPHGRSFDDIERHDTLIPSRALGVNLFLRNKHRKDCVPQPSVLLVHGATYPSVSLFDVDVGGLSVMDMLARQNLDVWALDIRGYGGSTRPPEMAQDPSEAATSLVPATEAADDVAVAIDHIRALRSTDRVVLIGMSWGGSVAGTYASQHVEAISRLILIAPLWLSSSPLRIDAGAPITTHRVVDVNGYKAGWLTPVPEERRDTLLPRGWFERWSEISDATDSEAPKGKLRAPSGAIADVRYHWRAGKPLYDPTAITAPVLILRGEWDVDVTRDMAGDLFDRLDQAERKTWIEIGSATHMLLMEPARETAIDAITAFIRS